MATRSKLTFLKLGHSPKVKEANRIVVVGAEDVGKTAVTVRFFTRKFLPEYTHDKITCYERTVQLDSKDVLVRIIDTPGNESYSSLEKEDIFRHADGIMVVYASSDKRSFLMGRELLKRLQQDFKNIGTVPVALVGNKDDLTHFRRVPTVEGQRVALIYPQCSFFECSAARDPDNVEHVFQEFLREVIQNKDSKKHSQTSNTLTVKSPKPRRNSAGNSTLSSWWRRPRSSSACENSSKKTK